MKPAFKFADDVRFSCSRCGDCCRTWNVMLGPGERETLESLDWTEHAPDLAGMKPAARVKQPGMETRQRLRRRPDGSCVYLGEDNQCRIHEHFGADAKPLLCRLYPFGFYPVGERIGVDPSFACKAVAEGLGRPLAERVPEWTRLVRQSSAKPDEKGHHLKETVALPADLVWELEHFMLGFLADEAMPLPDRMRCVLQFMKIATTGDPTAPTAAKLRQAMAQGIPIQIGREPSQATMDKTQRAIFYQWLFLCLNPPPFDIQDWPANAQEKEKSRRIKAGKRYLKRKGRPWIDDREIQATFQDIAAVDGDVFGRSAVTAPLEAFLKAKILGQKFLVAAEKELPLVEAAPKFFLTVPMTLWTAKALAADRGGQRVGEGDVRRALRLIDRTLGTLPTSALPRKQAEACDFIMLETDLVEAAVNDLVEGH